VQERTAELRESEARYRSLTELASDWYWEQDENGQLHQGVRPGAGDARHPVDPAGGRTARRPSRAGTRPSAGAAGATIAARQPFLDFVFHRVNADGSQQQFRVSGEPMFNQSCRFIGYRGIGVEIVMAKQLRNRNDQDAQHRHHTVRARTICSPRCRPAEFERLAAHLELVPMPLGDMLYEPGGQLRTPISPPPRSCRCTTSPNRAPRPKPPAWATKAWSAFRCSWAATPRPARPWCRPPATPTGWTAPLLKQEFDRAGLLQRLLLRYTQALMTQMAQTAACNRHHSLEQQLCRWLLLTLDRLPTGELVMTQELVASMLGVRREGITEAAGNLQRAGLISYRRGHIILGFGDVDALPPAVTAVTPVHQTPGVALNNPLITAEFSQPMAPITGSATFTLSCAAPCTSPAATVALDADKRVATLTLAGGLPLAPLTVYTATITGATSLATGKALAAPYSWQFTTVAAVPPVLPPLPPTVTAVVPVNNATGVARQNPIIAAVFSEPMAPIAGAASFTLSCAAPCVSPTGTTVSLDSAHRVATLALAPSTTLSPLTTYTATVSGATSLATGLALASPAVWRFTTGEGATPVIPPVAPTVTAVTPVANATGVALNNALISAAFSEPMAAITGSASFTVSCAAPCTSPSGTVSFDATSRVATFAMASGASLSPSTTYTATITGARSLATGLALASPYVWQFRTGLLADTTRPRVVLTVPATTLPGPTAGAPTNAAITALFSEDMAPASLSAGTFRLSCAAPCVAPAGAVNYVVGNRTAVLTPAAALAAGTTYTATITTGATDLAGNALAGNQAALPAASAYVWTFATAATAVPPANVSVLSTQPAASAGGVCTNASINATFSVPSGLRMDPSTINSAVFTVTGPAPGLVPVVAGSVVLDAATGRIASFSPLAP
jgi:hypothetical protein